jgi:hypothetical protein
MTVLALLYLALLIPEATPKLPPVTRSEMARPFLWQQDARWDSLEGVFAAARGTGCSAVRPALETGMRNIESLLTTIERNSPGPLGPDYVRLEDQFFSITPLVGVCPESVTGYLSLASRIRAAVKHQSQRWNMNDRRARETLYRLLYGGRSAVEEVLLQMPKNGEPGSLLRESEEPSATPAASLLGIVIHSGDILVSRGGVPTSALIARGNDFPGNFSHIALVHVDSISGRLSMIEAHIERGLAIASAAEYLQDKKLRIMVLRVRSDLPAVRRDPLLPERAASLMFRRAREGHVAYDFSMDHRDATNLFCSEVASSAYRAYGLNLWMGMSHISSPGLRAWLADFGVRNFETEEPSDLEYDPQLTVVAEWRDIETLRKDHIDNAVTEAMLEGAERGERLDYEWIMLPVSRLLKAYCVCLNAFGLVGKIPEGLTATSALKLHRYTARHEAAAAVVSRETKRFSELHGYEPPYWEILKMARTALSSAILIP